LGRRKLILIGLDGCDFRILNPLKEDGQLPMFSEFLENGTHGTLLSTLPPNTLPAWTSIFTGVNPGKHGITDFVIKENGQFTIANTHYRMVDSLWLILTKYDIKQIVVNEPVTFPPEKISGIMITGFQTPYQSKNFVYPSSIKDEIEKVSNGYETDLPLGFEDIIAKNNDKGYQMISEFAEKITKVAKYLIKNYDWQLFAVILTSTDRLQHFYLNESRYIRAHYKFINDFIEELINYETDTNILIVSDHGFGVLKKCFYVNSWLKDHGLVFEKRSLLNSVLSEFGMTYHKIASSLMKLKIYNFFTKVTPKSIKQAIPMDEFSSMVDLEGSRIICPSTNNGLFINDTNVMKIIPSIIKVFSTLNFNGEKPLQSVLLKKEVLWGPYAYRGSDIYLLPRYGYEISPRLVPAYLSPPSEFGDIRTGTHRPEGVFIAYGPDVSRGVHLNEPLFTWDVAPLVLHMLNLPVLSYMDGRVRKEIFKEGSEPAVNPVKYEDVAAREWVRARLKKLKGDRLGAK
jgi:predicted AlkP superfamily phosphohydrolase/phosphomutase